MDQFRPLRLYCNLYNIFKMSFTQLLLGIFCTSALFASPLYSGETNGRFPAFTVNADQTVRGKITDEKGAALPGVSVVLRGSSTGTVSNADGQYSIELPETGTRVLVFSFVGYLSKEITVGNQSSIDVDLAVDTKALEEVVVVGYGTQRNAKGILPQQYQ